MTATKRPVATSLSKDTGPPGTDLTLTGKNLMEVEIVWFDATSGSASLSVKAFGTHKDNEVSFKAPGHAPRTATKVYAVSKHGHSESLDFTFSDTR